MRVAALLLMTTVTTTSGCLMASLDRVPCDVDSDCVGADRCVNAFCAPVATGQAAIVGEVEGEGEGEVGEGEGEGEVGEGEGEGEGGGEGEGEGEGEGDPPEVFANCAERLARYPTAPSNYYEIQTPGGAVMLWCENSREGGGWTEVAWRDYNTEACPGEWTGFTVVDSFDDQYTSGACFRPDSEAQTAASFPVFVPYTEVMVSIWGFVIGNPDAFDPDSEDINGNYVDGISVTRGAVREHLFTFAASQVGTSGASRCPCLGGEAAPAFVGAQSFCDRASEPAQDYFEDLSAPLWDGVDSQCGAAADQWYGVSQKLPTETMDPIDVRLMLDEGMNDEDIGIMWIEIYVR